ncbi:MAG: hypothetical protein ABSG64_02470 [Solirubrobacteraceae bacterium]
MHRSRALALLGAAAALALAVSTQSATAGVAHSASGCRVLTPPSSLPNTLLRLHRDYMRYQPDVHNPKITGPVGPVHLGRCGGEQYAMADFDATYNGVYFGTTDQPERFINAEAGNGWVDIGNTGGDPCGAGIPTALLKAWKIVRSCPG